MPEYRTPGVHIEEVDRGPTPIQGVSTSVAGFVGATERGPLEPQLVTSWAEFYRTYGGFTTDADWDPGYDPTLAYAVRGFFENGGNRAWVARVVPDDWIDTASRVASADLSDGSNTVMTVNAIGPGIWGGNVVVEVDDASSGNPDRFKLRIGYFRNASNLSNDYDTIAKATNEGPPEHEEVYDELSADETETNYYKSTIEGSSSLVSITAGSSTSPPSNGTTSLSFSLSNPASTLQTNLDIGDYNGSDVQGQRIGLQRFDEIDEITMVIVPDETQHDDLRLDVIAHCERRKDRIAILGTESDTDLTGLPTSQSGQGLQSEYAALYYPWVTIRDPETDLERDVPPGGHVAGIYARSDANHGVHKAPANEGVRGIIGLERTITKEDQQSLNPEGVNCIRNFQGRGTLVWGARTTSNDPSWKYVNVRRLFMYIEESIEESTQWVVFEPNNPDLWARVRQSVSNFLTGLWEDGALMGTSPDEAFYVKCDRTTMTQNDIDNGRLICEIGIAPVKPAEFVVFRISQTTAGGSGGG